MKVPGSRFSAFAKATADKQVSRRTEEIRLIRRISRICLILLLAAASHAAQTNSLSAVALAKAELRILKVGNYLIQQGAHAQQISVVGQALGVAPEVRVVTVESLYYHAPMVGASPKQKGLEEEAWLPFIRGQWDGKGKVRLSDKRPETKQAFVQKPPDLVLLMADLNGKQKHGLKGKGDEYYDHLTEVMRFYADTCKTNGAHLVLWIHPGWQQALDFQDRKTKELSPMTEDQYAADLAAIQKGLDKIRAAVPEIEYLPVPWIFSRLRRDHPEVNLRPPITGQNGHLTWREYLVGAYALAAYLGAERPEAPVPTADELNKTIGEPAQKHIKNEADRPSSLLTAEQHQAIIDAVWKERSE